jgi:hypothetical protein
MTIRSFLEKLTQTFGWRKERCHTFASLVIGLLHQNNVQHHALSQGLMTPETLKSKLEKIRRFFAHQSFDYPNIAKQIVLCTFGKIPKMHLILDRTNWKFGSSNINYLVLAARVGKITFPLLWSMLDHSGCSDYQQRRDLLEQFRSVFGLECIQSFTADREFIGKDWMGYLCDHTIPFLSASKITALFNGVKAKETCVIS